MSAEQYDEQAAADVEAGREREFSSEEGLRAYLLHVNPFWHIHNIVGNLMGSIFSPYKLRRFALKKMLRRGR